MRIPVIAEYIISHGRAFEIYYHFNGKQWFQVYYEMIEGDL